MMNMSIACDMKNCCYNETNEHYCTLNHIRVAKDESHAQNESACMNYKPKC